MKKKFYTEWAYFLALAGLALGTAGMEASNFGVSMIVAPAYLIHLEVSKHLPFFSFGMAEYMLQGVLLLLTSLFVRRFKLSYLFSFVTAVLYGLMLDISMALIGLLPTHLMAVRVVCYAVGLLLSTAGVAMMFHTYIPGEAYEVFVMEASQRLHVDIHLFKTGFDVCFCLIAIALSFLFFGFGHFEGIKWGTVLCTLLNGWLISRYTKLFEKHLQFTDGLPLRKYFSR